VAYYFGKQLNQEMNVPIGLIHASWGGTPAEVWTPSGEIISDAILDSAAHKLNKTPWWPIAAGSAYNGMLASLTNYAIAGAIWYQGESNTGAAATYQKLFTAMITSWREKWKSEFPFYFVQLAPYKYGNKNIAALLREAQFKTLNLPKTGMIVTTDLAEDTLDIHPKNKRDVGIRLAKLALYKTYGKQVENAKSPFYDHIEIVKDKAIIKFDLADTLIIKNKTVTGLYIAGDDQHFYPAQAVIKNEKLVAWNKNVAKPVAVRYAFSNTAVGNIFTKGGMPVAPFRTDDWAVDTSIDNSK
jgi:sialate O-acetylesterase